MSEEEKVNGTDEDVQDKSKAKKAARHDGGVADLERVTDYAEEKELSATDISVVSFCVLIEVIQRADFLFYFYVAGHEHICRQANQRGGRKIGQRTGVAENPSEKRGHRIDCKATESNTHIFHFGVVKC